MAATSARERIGEQHIEALWSALREARDALERGALDALIASPDLVPLLRSLAADARNFADALGARLPHGPTLAREDAADAERPTVLVVDDDEDALNALLILLAADFRVLGTTNPADVSRLLREHAVDGVLTDMRMPGIDGLGVLDLVGAAADPKPPVLMMSAYLDPDERLRALERGVFDFQRKPIDPAELTTRLRQAVRYAQELERQRRLQQTDDLTGLFNRRALHASLAAALEEGARQRHPVALAILDQDGLKQINDVYGHGAGDRSIITIASILSRTRRSSDLVARMGGDEFAVVMPNTNADGASQWLERFAAALAAAPLELAPEVRVRLSVSYGIVSTGPSSFESTDGLFASADAALYAMKRAKRGAPSQEEADSADYAPVPLGMG